jgi:hypothetical protein
VSDEDKLELPVRLTTIQREVVHKVSDKMNLKHVSYGKQKKESYSCISKVS